MAIALPKLITYKELMLVYGYSECMAQKKLWIIRGILGKQQRQAVLIAEFCKAENVEKEIFMQTLEKEYQKIYSKHGKQLSFL